MSRRVLLAAVLSVVAAKNAATTAPVAAAPAPVTTARPTPRPVATTVRPTVKATPRPVAAPTTPRPTGKATPRPVAAPTTQKPTVKATPRPVAAPTTPRPTLRPTAKPAATPKPTTRPAPATARPTPRPVQTPRPTLAPTVHYDGHHQTDATIRQAVKLWIEDNGAALQKYGPIAEWDVSQVTDLSYLFCVRQEEMQGNKDYKHCVLPDYARTFDEDLSTWDTGRVTSMRGTFSFAQAFNAPIGGWRTSRVTDMDEMFAGKKSDGEATGFDQSIDAWDVSSVKTMKRMFKDCAVFNQPLHAWRTSSVTSLEETFKDAQSFNQQLPWDVSLVTNMAGIFRDAASFDQDLRWCVGKGVGLNLAFSMAPCEASHCGVQIEGNCTTYPSSHRSKAETSGPSAGKVILILFLALVGLWLLIRCYFVYERSQSQPVSDALEAEALDCYRRYGNFVSDVIVFVQERWAALRGEEDAGPGPSYELLEESPDGL